MSLGACCFAASSQCYDERGSQRENPAVCSDAWDSFKVLHFRFRRGTQNEINQGIYHQQNKKLILNLQ